MSDREVANEEFRKASTASVDLQEKRRRERKEEERRIRVVAQIVLLKTV